MSGYIGRFAPSPTGPLHAGSLVAALASWLDARVNQGQWLVRIEDVDGTRCPPGLDRVILNQLAACGLCGDQPPVYQSHRSNDYQQALNTLVAHGLAYPCGCTRKDIALNLEQGGEGKPRHGELIYPGTCRSGLQGKAARAWRLATTVCMEKQAMSELAVAVASAPGRPFNPSAEETKVSTANWYIAPFRPDVQYMYAFIAMLLIAFCGFSAWNYHVAGQIYLDADQRDSAYRDNTLEKIRSVWLYQDQVRFADLTTAELGADNAERINALAHEMLHFSPEARVAELVLDSALLLGRQDDVTFMAARYKAAFPPAYAQWVRGKPELARLP